MCHFCFFWKTDLTAEGSASSEATDNSSDDMTKPMQVNNFYIDLINELMPCIVGTREWSRRGSDYRGRFSNMASLSDEAYLMWLLDCYWNAYMTEWGKTELVAKGGIHAERPIDKPWFVISSPKDRESRKCGGLNSMAAVRMNYWIRRLKFIREFPCFVNFEEEFTLKWQTTKDGQKCRARDGHNLVAADVMVDDEGLCIEDDYESGAVWITSV